MIVLNNSSTNTNISRISVTRGHAKTTNEMQCITAFGDLITATNILTVNPLKLTATNGTSNVDIVASNSTTGQLRQVMQITITNNDTVSDTVNIFVGDTNTPTYTQIYGPIRLPSGYSLCYDHAQGWYVTDVNGIRASGTPSSALGGVVTVALQQNSGVNGGTASTGAWTKYLLTNILQNDLNIAALSSNQFTLPAGTYLVLGGFLTFHRTTNSQGRLRNVTDSVTVALSESVYSNNNSIDNAFPSQFEVGIKFTIAASKTFEIDYWATSTNGTDDLGKAVTTGEKETYGLISLQKVA